MIADVDVLVVGAGIAGVSAGAELAAHCTVAVLETEATAGHHSTGRSAAIYTENYGNPVVRRLAMASRPFLEPHLSPRGALWVGGADQSEALDGFAVDGRRLVPSIERVPARRVVELCPALDPAAVAGGGVWEPGAMDIDVHGLLTAFTRRLRERGGTFRPSAAVVGAERDGDRWVVNTSAGPARATWVVDAAGAWADEVAALFGVPPLGLRPLRRTAFLFDPPGGEDPRAWPLVIEVGEGWYFKPEGPRLLGSPADETPSGPCDARPEEIDVARALERIGRAFGTELRHAHRPWAGLRTFAADRTPVCGADPDVDGFFWLAGQGGYGIKTSPALARATASLLVSGALPGSFAELGLTTEALSPARFR